MWQMLSIIKRHNKVAIRTVDMGVVVIEIAALKVLSFGTASNFRFMAVHKIVDLMGP